MNINMPSLSSITMTRTNQAHVGTAKLTSLVPGQESASVQNQKSFGTFESYLVNAVSEMNSQQLDVNRVQEQLITDPDSVDIHDVTTAMAKAQMSLNLAQTVIDRLITGWNELSTNR
ncbi:flagellar hook-basal body complex protein FliE [Treponema sp.]|uniref:flagellar hook-basal body complex protein FliE n=1 Tax=Treponema sp. TaxID=166 RepID=UPI00388DBE74